MLPGLETAAVAGWLMLASAQAPVSARVECVLPEAPIIRIVPTTDEIKYDFSKSEAELTGKSADASSPYPLNADTVTRGLRHDEPTIEMAMEWGVAEYPGEVFCLWHHSVTLNIKLSPTIYVAREYGRGSCQKAVLEHERRHVAVDREIINKHAQEIGKILQEVVNRTGAVGPYQGRSKAQEVQKTLEEKIESALNSQIVLLQEDMRKSQSMVDSLEEYERVNAVCRREQDAGQK